jgi:4-carboxymuconolactone decarboxylase
MNDEERLALGLENVKKVYGDVLSMPEKFDEQGFIGYSLRTLFGDIYARSGLSLRDRRLIILGALAGLGADPSLFEIHLRSALGNGELNADELREVIMTILPYAGYPKTSPLYALTEKCLAGEKK